MFFEHAALRSVRWNHVKTNGGKKMNFLLMEPMEAGGYVKKGDTPRLSVLKCKNDDEAVYRTMQSAVDGYFDFCTSYFPGLPAYVDALCNDEGLFRPDLDPVLAYEVRSADRKQYGLLKGNILFTAVNDDGETIGLSEEQISGVKKALSKLSPTFLIIREAAYPVFYSIID